MDVMDVIQLITVEPIAFLYMFAIFGEYTCAQDLLFVNNCVQYLDTNECLIDKNVKSDALIAIESQTSQQLVFYNAILAITSIFSSFISGSYGDSYGRVVPLSVPPLLSFIAQIVLIISSLRLSPYHNIVSLIIVCGLLGGVSGGSPSFLANCFGFISDKSQSKQRTRRLVILEANIFCGAFMGSLVTGLMLNTFTTYGYIICFIIYATIHSFILVYNAMRLRFVESHDAQSGGIVDTFGAKSLLIMFANVIQTVFKRRPANNRKLISLLIVSFILVTYGTEVLTSLLFLYVRNEPLVWDTSMYAFYSGLKSGATGLALCLLPVAQYYMLSNICDTSIAMIGVLSRTLGLILIGFATNSYAMFSSIIVLTFSEYPLPAIRSLLSKLVDHNERGKIFAFLTLFHNLCTLSGGIVFPIIYKNAINTNNYSGICFQITAALQIIAISIFIYIRSQLKTSHLMPTANESNVYSEANSILAEDNAGDNENRDLIL